MTGDRISWRRWQLVAVVGLLVIVLLSVTTATGVWLAEQAGWPLWLGWVVGAVVGYLTSRTLLRQAMQRLLA